MQQQLLVGRYGTEMSKELIATVLCHKPIKIGLVVSLSDDCFARYPWERDGMPVPYFAFNVCVLPDNKTTIRTFNVGPLAILIGTKS